MTEPMLRLSTRLVQCLLLGSSLLFSCGAELFGQTAKSATPPRQVLDEKKLAQFDRFVQVMDLIQKNYFDETKVSEEALIQGAIEGMLRSLDPHSEFLPAERVLPNSKETPTFSPEIGIALGLPKRDLLITSVIDGSPAAKAGVVANDTLLRIDKLVTENMGLHEALRFLQGPEGSEVVLTLRSPNSEKLREVRLKRSPMNASRSVTSVVLPQTAENSKSIGYIRISFFSEGSGALFLEHLQKLDHQKIEGLVLDLRQNPGGFIKDSFQVCDAFLPPGAPIASIEGRLQAHSAPPYITPDPAEHPIRDYPVVVLIDHGTASAAELVAGALKDSKRSMLIGTKSFGKGSVQSLIALPDGSALKLTTGRYFTPDHRTIHAVGIDPNIVVVNDPIVEPHLHAWLSNPEAPDFDQLSKLQDRQLQRARDLIKGLLYMENSEASSASNLKP